MPSPAELRAIRAALRRGDVERLDRVAEAREELIEALFLASMEQASASVSLASLEKVLAAGNEAALIELMPAGEFATAARQLARGLRPALQAGAEAGLAQIVAQIGGQGQVDAAGLARWLRRYRLRLGTYLVTTSGEAALEILRTQVSTGLLDPQAAARAIKDGIGLSKPQAVALGQRAIEWKAEGLADSVIADRITAARADVLADRARLFGSEQSYMAAQQGQLEEWRAQLAAGRIGPESRQFWGTRQDKGVCPVCGPMNGQSRPLGRKFRTTNPNSRGEDAFDSPGPPPYGPHDRCRCYKVLVAVAGALRQAA
jgi:hypothetical protein